MFYRKLFVALLFAMVHPAYAAVTLDGTMGKSGPVSGPAYAITADLGRQVGGNLFFSFSRFDLIKGDVATFSGPVAVTNVISRVTGGSASSIDGTITSSINGANMYFLNPAGVMFGRNASIGVSGAFHVSTAEYLSLGTDGRFDVVAPINSVLTVSPPSAFGFVTDKRASIVFNGSNLNRSNDFTAVGGDINFKNASLSVASTNLNLFASASGGEISIDDGRLINRSINKFGDITIQNGSLIKLSAQSVGTSTGPLGYITFDAGNLNLTDSSTINAYTLLTFDKGGNITINAQDSVNLASGGNINVFSAGLFKGGDITINTRKLKIAGYGSTLSTIAQFYGDGGNITINATDSVTVANGGAIKAGTASDSDGNSGNISIDTGTLTVSGRDVFYSRIDSSTAGSGKGGSIIIKTRDSVTISDGASIDAGTSGDPIAANSGNAGSISIETNTLKLSEGDISSTSFYSTGSGGAIAITAVESINLAAGSTISSRTTNGGSGGNIVMDTKVLNLSDGAVVSSGTDHGGKSGDITINAAESINMVTNTSDYVMGIRAETSSRENAGNIVLKTGKLHLSDNAEISTKANSDAEGNGGNIEISATQSIILDKGSNVIASTESKGNAGNIVIKAQTISLNNGSTVDSRTYSSGLAGNIEVNATQSIKLDTQATIVAATTSTGNAGLITITTPDLSLAGLSAVLTSSNGSGNAGNVNIQSHTITLTDNALISSESLGTGKAGNLDIKAVDNLKLVDSSITTATVNADGGSITIDPLLVHLKNSSITTSVKGGTGNGGNIDLTAKQLLLDNSKIVAQADAGNGGNINLNADVIIQSPTGSLISASSNLGVQGSVVLSSPVLDVNAALVDMPSSLRDIASLSPRRCITTGDEISSFVVYACGASSRNPDAAIIGK
jgi:filamentous hemagglutinin family protein